MGTLVYVKKQKTRTHLRKETFELYYKIKIIFRSTYQASIANIVVPTYSKQDKYRRTFEAVKIYICQQKKRPQLCSSEATKLFQEYKKLSNLHFWHETR